MTITTFQHRRVKGQPRPKHTYRAARRNDMRGLVWKGARPTGGGPYRWAIRPNVSRKRPAKRYA